MKIEVGDKVYLPNEKKPYKVQVRDNRYIICTKPFNPKHTVLYFIIDLVRKVRGTDNMIFCFGYETKEQCEDNLKSLQDGDMEVSYRNVVPLDIEVE
jgi:hypothetical protein